MRFWSTEANMPVDGLALTRHGVVELIILVFVCGVP